MPEDYERSKEEWEATRNLLLSDDDDDDEDIFEDIFIEDTKATPESRKPIKRIFFLQTFFEQNQGKYFKMKEIQEELKKRDYPRSIKTIYRDMEVLRSYGIRYDYRKKAYVLPMPSKEEQNISEIEWAIEKDVKISFKPFHYSTSRSTPKEYSNKGEPLEGSPWEIKKNNGKEYLYVYLGEKKGFLTYRTDRLDDIKVLTQPREGYAEYIKEKEQNHTKSEVKIFNGYRGKVVLFVKIRFINRLLEQVYDEFGRDILIIREDDKHFTINRPISLSPPFYAWVATFGHSVKILAPKDAIKGMKKFLKDAADMYKEYNDDGEM